MAPSEGLGEEFSGFVQLLVAPSLLGFDCISPVSASSPRGLLLVCLLFCLRVCWMCGVLALLSLCLLAMRGLSSSVSAFVGCAGS